MEAWELLNLTLPSGHPKYQQKMALHWLYQQLTVTPYIAYDDKDTAGLWTIDL